MDKPIISFAELMKAFYDLLEIIIDTASWVWNALTTDLASIFRWFGITVPDLAIFDVTFGHLLLGSIGLFIVYTLIKWVTDIVL